MASSSSSYTKNGLSPDIYDIADYVNGVKQEFTPDVDEDTLMLGIFGYFGSLMSDMFQNDIIMAAEFANESIPTRAKFDKNVIAHALGLNITSLNATPAKMEVLLTFIEDEIINAIGGGSGEFTFDCDNKIYFGDLEFHTDYDIIIKRIKLKNGSYTYTAQYDMTGDGIFDNPVSDITNPYLTPPVTMKVNGTSYLFTSCIIRQVEKSIVYKKVLSDNTISSKTVNFEFESQMAAFDVDVKNSSGTTHLVPVYEGLSNSSNYPYLWFTYLDSSTIRIKFDRDSYAPRVNSDVEIRLQTTQGEGGNFTWVAEYPMFSFDSDRLGYSNITVQVRPLNGESKYGTNKKSVDDLKRIIPKEALSRGSITSTKDLENFFNAIDTDNSQMYLYKKRDNNMERLYYSYIVMKDALSNVIPTNTIDLMIRPDQLFTDNNRARLILKKGQIIKLDSDKTTGFISRTEVDEEVDYTDSFHYIIPYNFAICMDPMYGMYFLTTMDETRSLTFSYINEECLYQYIATAIDWKREYLENDDTYKLNIDIEQNIADDDSMVTVDKDGNILDTNIRCFIVFYNEEDIPYRYTEGVLIAHDRAAKISSFEFSMTSHDYIDKYNRIRVEGLTPIGVLNDIIDYGYMPANCKAMIHIVTKQPDYSTDLRYTDYFNTKMDLSTIITGLEGYCVSNSYTINNGINFFYDYSEIIYSTISVGEGEYIPPDEDPSENDDKKDYSIGGSEFGIPPSVMTIATELGVANAIINAFGEALGYMPKFLVDEDGTLHLEAASGVTTTVAPVVDLGTGEYVPLNTLPDCNCGCCDNESSGTVAGSYTIGDDTLDEVPSAKVIATEKAVVNAVQQALNELIGYMPKFHIGEDGELYLEDPNNDTFTTFAHDGPTLGEEGGWDENPYSIPAVLDNEGATELTETDNHYIIGHEYIDPDNANINTLATELGAYNLILNMLKIVKETVPIVTDIGDGIVTLSSDVHGTAVLGADAEYMLTLQEQEKEEDSSEEVENGCECGCEDCSCTTKTEDTTTPKKEDTEVSVTGSSIIPAEDGIGYVISPEEAKKYHFIVENVPVIKADYFRTEEMVQFFCSELIRRKNYIDEALEVIEDSFGINFKFVNTYGPSRLFTLDNSEGYINRVNLSLTFRIGLQVNYDENILTYIKDDIKEFIEDINSIDSIHMSNLVTDITNKYQDSITFFEFIDMNGYGMGEQHLYSMPMPDNVITPELINVHTREDFTPDINIIIA